MAHQNKAETDSLVNKVLTQLLGWPWFEIVLEGWRVAKIIWWRANRRRFV